MRTSVVTGAVFGTFAAIVLAGCSSSPTANGTAQQQAAQKAALPLATSQTFFNGTSWAVTRHGSSWQLSVRPPGKPDWQMVTPGGVTSTGGLVIAGNGSTQVSGFRTGQHPASSPLTFTMDQGSSWRSWGKDINPGLASVPSALALSTSGQVLAVTDTGTVRRGAHVGGIFSSLTSRDSLARSVGKPCDLTSLTAAAFSGAGAPMLGGACGKPGTAGIFEFDDASWHAEGPTLPASLSNSRVSVLGLATVATRTTALLAVGSGSDAGLVAAWTSSSAQSSGTGKWTMSPELKTGTATLASLSLWPDGAAGLVLNGSRGESIAGPGSSWSRLAALPAGTATLALGPAGQLQALAPQGSKLATWQLGSDITPGNANSKATWHQLQTVDAAKNP